MSVRMRALMLPLVLVTACGTPAPARDANATSTPAADAAAPSDAPTASTTTGVDDGGAPPKADAAATEPLSSTAKGDVRVDDGDDACAAVAAAFEKRARPAIKACYREGKKKDANLVGGVRLGAAVTQAGKLGNVFSSPNGDKKLLPPAVVKCMVDAVKATDPGDIAPCKGKSLAIPVQFPSQ